MKLVSVSYVDNIYTDRNLVRVKDISLDSVSLIVGDNASGKTRILDAIFDTTESIMCNDRNNCLANICRNITFTFCSVTQNETTGNEEKKLYEYNLVIAGGYIIKESLYIDHLFEREFQYLPGDRDFRNIRAGVNLEMIFSFLNGSLHLFSFSARRDWACTNTKSFLFYLKDKYNVLIDDDMDWLGFPRISCIFERLDRINTLSSGELFCLEIMVFIHRLISRDRWCYFAVDDFGCCLDRVTAGKLTKWVLEKIDGTKLQIIFSTHNRYVMNAIDVRHWNILEMDSHSHEVVAYNYTNSKKAFDDFALLGLSNCDLLYDTCYKDAAVMPPF